MPPQTIDNLVDELRRGRLLDGAQLDELARDLAPRFPDARALAGELVRRGWLTPYQVNQLFQGRGGDLLLGSYVLLERLGEGGMGTVYKARNWKLGRVVALKVIRKERLADADTVRRFQREIRAAAKLDHPNVVRAYDADCAGDVHFFVMEYVEGTSLSRLVKECGALPVDCACEYVRQAALGLQHAFERGLVHRDVKPANLLLGRVAGSQEQGTVKVLDLGLALPPRVVGGEETSAGTLTAEGVVMGTPDYIAPEQIDDPHAVDIRADLYSLGCTFYYLLAGRAPFAGGSLGQKLVRHQTKEPPLLEQVRPEVPIEVAAVVRKLMAKRPADRYQTPAELAKALEALPGEPGASAPGGLRGLTPPARQTEQDPFARIEVGDGVSAADAPWRLEKAAERRRLIALNVFAVAVLAGLVVAAVVFFWPGAHPSERERPEERTAAEKAWNELLPRIDNPKVDPAEVWRMLQEFLQAHPDTPQAALAAERQRKVFAPLGSLERQVPASEQFDWQPSELVRVLGEHHGRDWGTVLGVAFGPDDKFVVSSSDRLRFWDTETLQEKAALKWRQGRWRLHRAGDGWEFLLIGQPQVELWDLQGPPRRRRFWAFPKDDIQFQGAVSPPVGRHFLTCDKDRLMQLWDLDSDKEIGRFQGPAEQVACLALSSDGRLALSGGRKEGTVRLWEVASGKELHVLKGHTHPINSVAFSPDGRHALSGGNDGTSRLWNMATGQEVHCLHGPAGRTSLVAFSPDGRRALSGVGDGTLRLWEVESGREVRRLVGHLDPIECAVFSADSHRLVSGGWDGIRLWDVESGKELLPHRGHSSKISGLAFSPDGRRLFSSSADRTVRTWDVLRGKELGCLKGHTDAIKGMAVSADGRRMISGAAYSDTLLWDLATGKPSRSLPAKVQCVGISRDGRLALTGGGVTSQDPVIRLWDFDTGRELRTLEGHTGHLMSVTFSPDGRRILSTAEGDKGPHNARLWDVETGKGLRRLDGFTVRTSSGVFFPEGRRALVGSWDGTVLLWDFDADPSKPATVLAKGYRTIHAVALSPDGTRWAVANDRGKVAVFESDSGKKVHDWELPGPVYVLALSPDGRHLATGNSNGTIYVLRLNSTDP